MPYTITCNFCNREKITEWKNSIFCSRSCRAKCANSKRSNTFLLKCKECNKEFSVTNYGLSRKYCSKTCFRISYKKFNPLKVDEKYYMIIENDEADTIPIHPSSVSMWVRSYLIRKNGNFCQNKECGWDKSKPTMLEIDHIDGDFKNNKLSNVRILCCNCHSQTPNFRSKNYGKSTRKNSFK